MDNNDPSIFEEVSAELKYDQQAAFLKKHKNVIMTTIALVVIGILAYSSWYEKQKKSMENVTNTLLTLGRQPIAKQALLMEKLLEMAPTELRPLLLITQSGKKILSNDFSEKHLKQLLDLSERSGVELIWKDLALLVYASYPVESTEKLLERLKMLTQEGRPFRYSAMELSAMIYAKDGKLPEAVALLKQILESKDAPKTMKQRISILKDYLNCANKG